MTNQEIDLKLNMLHRTAALSTSKIHAIFNDAHLEQKHFQYIADGGLYEGNLRFIFSLDYSNAKVLFTYLEEDY
jgi:hypothetical protein